MQAADLFENVLQHVNTTGYLFTYLHMHILACML
jgi:hypothetical protein